MKKTAALTSLFVVTLIIAAQLFPTFAQEKVLQEKAGQQSDKFAAAQQQPGTRAEERMVRWAYKKMNILHAVERFIKAKKQGQKVGRALGLKTLRFTLSDFHTGPIQEIQNSIYRELVTAPNGEVIQVVPISSTHNNGDSRISIEASWQPGQYASGFDPHWTVGDVLQLEAARFHDVTRYASYQVTATLEEKSRTYRALVLFHDKVGGPSEPEFLDSIAGMGGSITQIFKDTRLPLGLRPSTPQDAVLVQQQAAMQTSSSQTETVAASGVTTSGFDDNSDLNLMCGPETCGGGCLEWYFTPIDPSYTYCMVWWGDPWGYDYGDGGSSGSTSCTASASIILHPQFYNSDSSFHLSGTHYARTTFQSKCSIDTSCIQNCDVDVYDGGYNDSGVLDEYLYYHVGGTSVNKRSSTSSGKNSTASCETAQGYAFKRCIIDCGISVTVGVQGQGGSASVTVSGGDLWNVGHIKGRTCTNGQ